MKAATAYERRGKIYIHSDSKTTTGLWLLSEPVLSHPVEERGTIAESIRIALNASHEGLPHPKIWTNLTAPLLEAAGVSSFNTFAKSTKCVSISSENGMITLTPTRNGGTKTGFAHLNEQAIQLDEASDRLDGELMEAFARSE